jgi:CelD/BcsL family acetyltransferase involved in cellulose biosynthesis
VNVHAVERFDAVGVAAWQRLHARTALRSPFLAWTWQTEWATAFGGGRRLRIWRVDDADDEPVALLPLIETGPGDWMIVGGAAVSDYLDLIAVDGHEHDAWAALLGARGTTPARWTLHAVPAASPTVKSLPAIGGGLGLAVTADVEERCPVLALPRTWDDYLAGLAGKKRHELTRKMRRLEREAPEARPTAIAGRADVERRFGDFLALHRRSHEGKARFMDATMERFFRRTAAALADLGQLRLWFMDGPRGPLASFITLEWDGTVGLYNSGFDPDAAGLAPGLVLLAHVVRDAIVRGFRRFDFLRGEERYKYDFGPTPEDVYRVVIR